ncbi:MAG: pyruvate formate lyase family protein, partial [Planctomycetota bacterium]|nr:pyruvate formate lyase family protein [Planctomycetota bacterium]
FPSVIELGFEGIAETIQANLNTVELAISRRKTPTAEQRKKRAFYRSGLTVCDAAIQYGKRWAQHLQAQAAVEIDPQRQEELFELASIFERVPAKPAQTFHEALQSMFVAHVILHQESFQHGISFGRMDQYLYPYLERDLASKRITCERAVDLLGCFLGKAAELIPLFFQRATQYFSGLSSASGITLGGRTEDGKDAVNLLSHLFLIAYDQIRLRQPNLHVRVHSESEPAFMDRCYEVLKKGGGMPAFFNDEEVVEVLEGRGVAKAHAQDYSIVGCVEWGVPYRSFPAAGSAFMSLPYILELTLGDGTDVSGDQVGPHTGKVEHFTDTASLLAAFRIQLKHCLQVIIDGNNAIEMAHALHRPTPMLSVLVGGCVAKGRDVTAGGAEYNSSGVQGVGMADVVDSVAAIEELV